MTRFYIVRHGETQWNLEGRIQGHIDTELTDKGVEQARLASERLKHERIDAVFASDKKRATKTGETIAAAHGLDVETTPLLREAYLGEWQGLSMSEVAERYPEEYAKYRADSIANRPPGAEYLQDVIKRCDEFLKQVLAKHPEQYIAVAAHGGSVRGLIAAAFGLGPDVYRRIRLDNGGLTIIDITDSKPLLVLLNDTCYLQGQGLGDGADQ
jgi:phosphoserine phosphatase